MEPHAISHRLLQQDLEIQASALAAARAGLRQAAPAAADLVGAGCVTLTGSGDSLAAGLALEPLARSRLGNRWRVRTPEAIRLASELDRDDTIIAVSFSGSGARTLEAASAARSRGVHTIAVTASPDGPLAKACDAVVLIEQRGPSRAIPHVTDYSVTLLAVASILEALGAPIDELDLVGEAVDRTLQAQTATRARLAAELRPTARTYFLGVGGGFGTATYGAAKWWEAGGLAAWASDAEEFGHGLHLVARPGDVAFLLTDALGSAASQGVLAGLSSLELITWTVGREVCSERHLSTVIDDPRLAAFSDAVPLQVACLELSVAHDLDVTMPPCGVGDPSRYQRYRATVNTAYGSARVADG